VSKRDGLAGGNGAFLVAASNADTLARLDGTKSGRHVVAGIEPDRDHGRVRGRARRWHGCRRWKRGHGHETLS
jgi:hypothetical protein